jgi:23S rRNA pseudouridine1911/1915/1917 synthase
VVDEPQVRILYRDSWLVVADKPSGVLTQGAASGELGLFEALQSTERYVGLHHRLDRPASGLVLFTVDRRANRGLSEALQARRISRTYAAVLSGHAESGSWTQEVSGKDARSDVEVLSMGAGMSRVRVSLHTGRKHQIRVQAAMNRVPVIGDRRYGGRVGHMWPRLALHACSLSLAHPITGEPLLVTSPIPEDLAELWGDTRVGESRGN